MRTFGARRHRREVDGNFYCILYEQLDAFLSSYVNEGYAPEEAAVGMLNALEPGNYGADSKVTELMDTFYFDVEHQLRRALGDVDSYHPDEIYEIVAQWAEKAMQEEIKNQGWFVDGHTQQWTLRAQTSLRSRVRTANGSLANRRMPVDAAVGGYEGARRGGGLYGNSRRLGGGTQSNWTTMVNGNTTQAQQPEERPVQQERTSGIMGGIARANRPTVQEEAPVRINNGTRPMNNDFAEIEEGLKAPIETFEYEVQDDEVKAEQAHEAKTRGIDIKSLIKAIGSNGTDFDVYDMQFLTKADGPKTVISFAQEFFEDKDSFLARINYTRVAALEMSEELYEKVSKSIRGSIEDIVNSEKPGAMLDTIIYDNLTRNEGKKIEKIFVNEFNRRMKINHYNAADRKGPLGIDEFKDIDEVLFYKPYMEIMGENASGWTKSILFTVRNILQKYFVHARRINGFEDKNLHDLFACDRDMFANGLRLVQALSCEDKERKKLYFDAFFKKYICLYIEEVAFYTDILEEARVLPEVISQLGEYNMLNNALLAGFEANDPSTENKGFTIGQSMKYSHIPVFVKRSDFVAGYDFTFPVVPTTAKILKRNLSIDMGYVNSGENEDVTL